MKYFSALLLLCLVVLSTNAQEVYNRPQNPTPPYPYIIDTVQFASRDTNVKLAGTLTIPRGVKNPKCVILLTGSGAQDRDESILGHKPFWVLADYLTRGGVAVLRFDDRGMGGSGGDFSQATIYNFVNDALGALDFVKQRKGIGRGVGFLGHSEGGKVAVMAAVKEPKRVSFVVSMAGGMVRSDSILIKQNEAIMLGTGGLAALSARPYAQALRVVYALRERHSVEFIKENLDSLKATELEPVFAKLLDPLKNNALTILTMSSVSFDAMIAADPTEDLRALRCDFLALNGEKDVQVDARMNLSAVKSLVPQATIKQYEGLNHLFQNCTTGMMQEYGKIEQTIAPIVLEDILQWVKSRK